MTSLLINKAGFPLNNINGGLVNVDTSNVGGIPFSNTTVPNNIYTLAPAGNNVQSAASIYPCAQKGGKINRKKINKISRKYKMKGSKKTVKRRVRKIKSKVRSRYSAKKSRSRKGGCWKQKGGAQPTVAPNYPAGHTQYQNNNGALTNVYSTGGPLSAGSSALANPPPFKVVANATIPDNLDHYSVNAFGKSGAGSGFPSRGWF